MCTFAHDAIELIFKTTEQPHLIGGLDVNKEKFKFILIKRNVYIQFSRKSAGNFDNNGRICSIHC